MKELAEEEQKTYQSLIARGISKDEAKIAAEDGVIIDYVKLMDKTGEQS